MRSEKSDNKVFNLYKANTNEVWEINFVISCFVQLVKGLKSLKMITVRPGMKNDQTLRMLKQKMQNTKKCIEELDCFCNNKSSNSLPD